MSILDMALASTMLTVSHAGAAVRSEEDSVRCRNLGVLGVRLGNLKDSQKLRSQGRTGFTASVLQPPRNKKFFMRTD